MSIFEDHKIEVKDLLKVIPEELLTKLAQQTKVDHYAKVLQGKKLFYLLMFGIIEHDRLSQRSLADTFNDPFFKQMFSLDKSEQVRRSSISERLSKIDPDYFKQIYECIYDQFSQHYSLAEREKYNLIRVDSTIVYDISGKMEEGLGHKKTKKAAKFSMCFDGLLPAGLNVFTEATYASEDKALPSVIFDHVKKNPDHCNIYVFDRGLQSGKTMKQFSDQNICFVARLKENRKYIEKESLITEAQQLDMGEVVLMKDSKIQLYGGEPTKTKSGTIHYDEHKVENEFRLIIIKVKNSEKEFWLLTNNFELTPLEVADIYKSRWDIEVFFRFIKQELSVSHFISLNRNGMQVMIYLTMIVAMLLLIYKKLNNIGYKTAKRRFKIELRNLVITIIVLQCGGNPDLYFKT